MSETLPFFSVVIATHSRVGQLSRCLEALTRLDYPRERFEVIVVDDGGDEGTQTQVKGFGERLDVVAIRQPRGGAARARNNGARGARGDYLVFTDDDCEPSPGWLRPLAARLERAPRSAVGGRTLNGVTKNLCSTASQLLIDYLFRYFNPDPEDARFLTSNNLAFPAEGFRAIGGFDTTFPRAGGEDRELCDRWRHHGHPMMYAAEWTVSHSHELSVAAFLRQHWNYGRGAFRFHRLRADRGQMPIRIEPLRFYLDLVRFPATRGCGARAVPLAVMIGLSQLANAAGFFAERLSRALGGPAPAGSDSESRPLPRRRRD